MVKEGVTAFVDDNALTRGAAIAFYAVIAIVPVLFIATAIAALGLGSQAASGAVLYQLRQMMSKDNAQLVQLAIVHVRGGSHTVAGSLIGAVTLLVTASGFFTEIEDALNAIWRAPRTAGFFYQLIRGRLLSLALVFGIGFLFTLSMMLAAGIGTIWQFLAFHNVFTRLLYTGLNLGVSLALMTALFAAIYKILPNKSLIWRDVLVGALVTALLFEAGQVLIALYLASFVSANVYGAAGGVIVLLVWIYYSAQIFLLGAEFTKVWAKHFGSQQQGDDI